MKTSLKIMALICAAVMIFSIAGVYAIWDYKDEPLYASTSDFLNLTLAVPRPTELPDDDEDDEKGTNHWFLVDTLVN